MWKKIKSVKTKCEKCEKKGLAHPYVAIEYEQDKRKVNVWCGLMNE